MVDTNFKKVQEGQKALVYYLGHRLHVEIYNVNKEDERVYFKIEYFTWIKNKRKDMNEQEKILRPELSSYKDEIHHHNGFIEDRWRHNEYVEDLEKYVDYLETKLKEHKTK